MPVTPADVPSQRVPLLAAAERRAFLDTLEPGEHITQLMSCLPETNYFAKDTLGRFVLVDDGFVEMLSRRSAEEILGRTDHDFFPRDVAEKYVRDDRNVMTTGQTLRGMVEAVPDEELRFHWWVVNKVPLRDRSGQIVGIAGVTSKLSAQNAPHWHDGALGRALQLIGSDYRNRLSIGDLARQAGISIRSLERTFVRTFHTTPLRYLNRVRLQAARHALVHTDKPIATIAVECGFYDQSHLTTQFSRSFGQSPSRYRRTHAPLAPASTAAPGGVPEAL
jgi:AraC-like DNA-binding protein